MTPSKIKIQLKRRSVKMFTSHKTVLYIRNDVTSNRLAMFDLDSTIIKTKSGLKFATDENDWIMAYNNVIKVLKKYHEDGYKLVIFSNQSGVSTGKTDQNKLQIKLNSILNTINVPIEVYIATAKDSFRKPMTDIWTFFLHMHNLKKNDLHKDSFYCGDAAGRPKNYLPNHPKDFNISDRYFAQNIGLSFKTPEEIFLNMLPFKYNDKYLTESGLSNWYPNTPFPLFTDLKDSNRNLIILVGSPASGKSSASLLYDNYVYLNNDTIKNKNKLNKMFQTATTTGDNILLDNTNPKKTDRKYYVDIAKKAGYHVYCCFFDLPKQLVYHLNQMRVQMSHGISKAIPMVAFHVYYKYLNSPTAAEGFDQIITINKMHLIDELMDNAEIFNLYYCYSYDI